jgi:hypothetical protein
VEYTFFSVAHGSFFRIFHILVHKASPNKYKKIEITPCILSDPDCNRKKLELNLKRNHIKYLNT